MCRCRSVVMNAQNGPHVIGAWLHLCAHSDETIELFPDLAGIVVSHAIAMKKSLLHTPY